MPEETERRIISILHELRKQTAAYSYHDPNHPLYQEILNIDESPGALVRYLRKGKHYAMPKGFWWGIRALSDITGVDPTKPTSRGNYKKTLKDWQAFLHDPKWDLKE